MILYTDHEPFVCDVLRARVADGGLLPGDVWERDVRTLTAEELKPYTQVHLFCGIGASPLGLKWAGWPAELSVVTGGFPCQDISVAGKGAGIDGARSGLWKEMHRVVDIVRPRWVIAENVPALRTRGIDRVLGDMERIGYDCWPLVVGADDVGAPHRRKRVWVVGMADTAGIGRRADGRTCGSAGHADGKGAYASPRRWPAGPGQPQHEWEAQRLTLGEVGWSVDGLSRRLASRWNRSALKALGNAQVPQVVELVARAILSYEATASERSGG